MKKNVKYILVLFISIVAFFSCEYDDNENYDVSWPIPEITSVSSYNDFLSSEITLTGNFKNVKKVSFGDVVGDDLQVASDEGSLTVKVPRTMNVEGAPIIITNEYTQTYQTLDNFVPKIQSTTVTEVSNIQVGLTFTVAGTNVDLLTEVAVDGVVVPFVKKDIEKIILSVSDLDLKPGTLVDVSFKSLAKDDIPVAEKVEVIYPFIAYNEVIIFDFEDGTHSYTGEGTAIVETGDVLGTTEKYFSLRAPGYGWDKATGEISTDEVPDISGLVNPYLTFAVRTPAGSAGYFEMADQDGHWRHFGYGYDTGGSWVIISMPLNESWEGGGDFNPGSFKPKLTFKAGNAGTQQDVDVAYVKITEGAFDGSQMVGDALVGSTKPAKLVVMDFENTSDWPDVSNGVNVIASTTLRKNEINPFFGNEFFTYTDDGTLGNWGAYWGQSISKDMQNSQISVFNDPYLSFAANTIPDNAQYIIVRFWQHEEQLEMVQKFFPNTNGEWETYQLSVFNTELENWSKGGTALGDHFTSLKKLTKDAPIDKIEVIIGRSGSNTVGVSIDDMVITEGPRF